MTSDLIHLLVRQTADGLYATSPQAPGFIYGRKSLKELRNDLEDALCFHFDETGPFSVLEHHEHHYVISGGELVTRIANDEHKDERQAVYARLGDVIKDKIQAEALAYGVTNPVGESVYVCALPQDTVGWLMDQLNERGDAVSAAVLVADRMLLTLPIAYGDTYGKIDGRYTLAESDFDRATTLSEIIQVTNVVTPVPVRPINRRSTTSTP
ncbi:hypothetical protein [Streptomyces subrutilus]|uniref:hypothetical protein n=1 Tax=Streptomyces subrutilus TaxID=36818 RepID=UPI002E12B835|nr:hypothetical protein OG479_23895 [Streptomyces subrutilus]